MTYNLANCCIYKIGIRKFLITDTILMIIITKHEIIVFRIILMPNPSSPIYDKALKTHAVE